MSLKNYIKDKDMQLKSISSMHQQKTENCGNADGQWIQMCNSASCPKEKVLCPCNGLEIISIYLHLPLDKAYINSLSNLVFFISISWSSIELKIKKKTLERQT